QVVTTTTTVPRPPDMPRIRGWVYGPHTGRRRYIILVRRCCHCEYAGDPSGPPAGARGRLSHGEGSRRAAGALRGDVPWARLEGEGCGRQWRPEARGHLRPRLP